MMTTILEMAIRCKTFKTRICLSSLTAQHFISSLRFPPNKVNFLLQLWKCHWCPRFYSKDLWERTLYYYQWFDQLYL